MRIAVLSDIHANKEALQAVLEHMKGQRPDILFYLGDLVGYNPDPEYCVSTIFDLIETDDEVNPKENQLIRGHLIRGHLIRGNHDKAVSQKRHRKNFNPAARQAISWTTASLSATNRSRLRGLPEGPLQVYTQYLICHGSPMDEDRYVFQRRTAEESMRYIRDRYPEVRVCFFGHTHIPMIIEETGQTRSLGEDQVQHIDPNRLTMINPGSVGQPRDGVTLAAYGLYDTDEHSYVQFRVAFSVRKTQKKILTAGLPSFLAERLSQGH